MRARSTLSDFRLSPWFIIHARGPPKKGWRPRFITAFAHRSGYDPQGLQFWSAVRQQLVRHVGAARRRGLAGRRRDYSAGDRRPAPTTTFGLGHRGSALVAAGVAAGGRHRARRNNHPPWAAQVHAAAEGETTRRRLLPQPQQRKRHPAARPSTQWSV